MNEPELDLEPDDLEPDEPRAAVVPLDTAHIPLAEEVMPRGFNLRGLLYFLPDIRLKQKADRLAEAALAVSVHGAAGLQQADAALPPLREAVAEIEQGFKEPVDLANQLHKRLTGLRGDFLAKAKAALETMNGRIYTEKRRLERLAEEERAKAQADADRRAREELAQAAKDAKARKAPKEVVEQMKEAAKTATAPPVETPTFVPTLGSTSTVDKWKARLRGTPEAAEPNPENGKGLTAEQQESLRRLCAAIGQGLVSTAAVKSLDWGYLNARANAERSTLDVPGIEAFEAGSARAKGSRRK